MKTDEHKPLLLSCGILREEIGTLQAQGRIRACTHFLSSRLHFDYGRLGKVLAASMAFFRRQYGQRIVVVYGDACLGFNGEMARLVEGVGLTKVKAVNCIDCQLGGGGRLLEIDPDHRYYFLNRAFIRFSRRFLFDKTPAEVREQFKVLEAIVPVDPLGDLDAHREEMQWISDLTGLPLHKPLDVGLGGVEKVLAEAIARLPDS